MRLVALAAALLLTACATTSPAPTPRDAFFARLSSLCGQRLSGRLVSNDPQDSEMVGQPLIAHFHQCEEEEVRIRFQVGDDSSRNWVVTRTAAGIRLKHIHLHDDGSEDAVSRYGGDTVKPGTAQRQEFPADDFSKDLFVRNAIPQSVPNIWAMEVEPPSFFAYELRRPGRFFRVEFDRPAPQTDAG